MSQRSLASGWTVAQVLSHLGSAAEICTMLVKRAIAGDTSGPAMEDMRPVWQRWDALAGPAQRDAWQAANTKHYDCFHRSALPRVWL
ncbi:maleylpyruvate isomerase N-terminal domain-containing protein [Planotetraspora silvatica]